MGHFDASEAEAAATCSYEAYDPWEDPDTHAGRAAAAPPGALAGGAIRGRTQTLQDERPHQEHPQAQFQDQLPSQSPPQPPMVTEPETGAEGMTPGHR